MKSILDRDKIFWLLVIIFYAICIATSFNRIYVAKNYPIFYSESDKPDPLSIFFE